MSLKFFAAAAVATLLAAGSAAADTVSWTNWTSQPDATHAEGSITAGMNSVDVSYEGSIFFTQLNNAGTDYWVDGGYTQGVVNRPTGTDLISLDDGGLKTISFSHAVLNPYLAFTSWNNNTVTFSAPFTVISQGCGYWGCGTFIPNMTNTGFSANTEVHGVLQFQGAFTSLSFNDTNERWHGFTVGVGSVSVPEPATWAMMIMGFGAVGAVVRRRRALAFG